MEFIAYQFKNFGYISTNFSEFELFPIKEEINQIITNNFKNSIPTNHNLAGNIEKEYNLIQSKSHIEKLILPLCGAYDQSFEYLKTFKFLTDDVPLILDSSWVNFQKKHEFNPLHNHSGIYSFVIWIDIPYFIEDEKKNPSSSNSNHNIPGQFEFAYTNSMGRVATHVIPADKKYNNSVIFFPSCFNHIVYPFYTSDEYRISVSGNIKLKV